MEVDKVLAQARDAITVKRVYGTPYEKDGLTLIPAAVVGGGGGGGSGEGKEGEDSGKGAGVGFGLGARPVGAFVIKDGTVTWRPVIDLNRVILGAQIVAVVALLALRAARKG
jgi:uncharacterized spore protein YtfJ